MSDVKTPRPATIIEGPEADNGYVWKVQADDGATYRLVGLGAPMGDRDKVGDRGTVKYTSGASFGLWFWNPLSV